MSDLVLGPILIGFVPRLPMKGVSMLLGNQLSSGKITIYSKVMLESVTSIDTEKIEEENSGILPSCAVTQAQTKGEAKKEKICGAKDETIDLS